MRSFQLVKSFLTLATRRFKDTILSFYRYARILIPKMQDLLFFSEKSLHSSSQVVLIIKWQEVNEHSLPVWYLSTCNRQMRKLGELLQRDTSEGFFLFPKSPLHKPCGDLIITFSKLNFGIGIILGTMSEQLWFMKPWV